MEKLDLLNELETAQGCLQGDMQQLAYIQENLEAVKRGDRTLDISYITNSIETLFKAMLYNKEKMKNAINKAYNLKKEGNV